MNGKTTQNKKIFDGNMMANAKNYTSELLRIIV